MGAAHEHTQLMDGLPADCHTDSWPQDRGGGEDLMEACKVPSSFPGKPMCLCATRERTYSTISPPHCTDSHAHRHTHSKRISQAQHWALCVAALASHPEPVENGEWRMDGLLSEWLSGRGCSELDDVAGGEREVRFDGWGGGLIAERGKA